MGDVYHQQKRYNFALVHYFNTMDIENTAEKKDRLADVLVAIADTYLRLERYPRAQKYLSKAISFAENSQEKKHYGQSEFTSR